MFKLITLALLCMTTEAARLQSHTVKVAEPAKMPAVLQLAQMTLVKGRGKKGKKGGKSEHSAEEILAFFDADGNGRVTLAEFLGALEALCEEAGYEPTEEDKKGALEFFDAVDQDDSGEVDIKEVKDAIAWFEAQGE